VNLQPNILFTVHKGAPFVGDDASDHNLLLKGRPFIMRFRQLLRVTDLDLDNCVIYVRRAIWNGRELSPKTKNAVREIDIDSGLAELLRWHVGVKRAGRVFEARNGSPISGNNILKRVLHPFLQRLGLPRAGLHAFRHSRVTMLRKRGTPADLQKQWIGHSSLRTTDRCSHTDQELEYRRLAASKVGLNLKTLSKLDPIGPKTEVGNFSQVHEKNGAP
jgi:integrase